MKQPKRRNIEPSRAAGSEGGTPRTRARQHGSPRRWPVVNAALLAATSMVAYATLPTLLSVQKFRYDLYTDIDFPIIVQAE